MHVVNCYTSTVHYNDCTVIALKYFGTLPTSHRKEVAKC